MSRKLTESERLVLDSVTAPPDESVEDFLASVAFGVPKTPKATVLKPKAKRKRNELP